MQFGNQKKKSTHFQLPLKNEKFIAKPTMDPYTRHKHLMKHYKKLELEQEPKTTEIDILKQNHQFVRHDSSSTWAERLAEKYYNKLYKEYCLANFSRYKTGQLGLRWRTKNECIMGKGQFICANLKCHKTTLKSYEILFRYKEGGEVKREMVKIRLCKKCADKMNYGRKSREEQIEIENRDEKSEDEESAQDEGEKDDQESGNDDTKGENSETNLWAGPAEIEMETSKEEDMDKFLDSLLL